MVLTFSKLLTISLVCMGYNASDWQSSLWRPLPVWVQWTFAVVGSYQGWNSYTVLKYFPSDGLGTDAIWLFIRKPQKMFTPVKYHHMLTEVKLHIVLFSRCWRFYGPSTKVESVFKNASLYYYEIIVINPWSIRTFMLLDETCIGLNVFLD